MTYYILIPNSYETTSIINCTIMLYIVQAGV